MRLNAVNTRKYAPVLHTNSHMCDSGERERYSPVPPSPTKTSLNVGTSAMMMNLYMSDLSCFCNKNVASFTFLSSFSSLLIKQ